jgi:hypothetical protein
MADRMLGTVNYWSVQMQVPEKGLRSLMADVEPDGLRGESQKQYFLSTILEAQANSGFAGKAGELDPVQELARKNKSLADKTEIEIALKTGELGVISQVADWYGNHIRKCKARLVQIPDAVGQFCDPRNAVIVVAEVRRLIHEALAELAAGRPRLGHADTAGMGAAADPDGQRVGGPESPAVERGERGAGAVANQ